MNKEITDRENADNTLQANIDNEKTARENADQTLQNNKVDKSITINGKSLNNNIKLYGTDIELASNNVGNLTDAIINVNRRVDNILLNTWPVNSVYISIINTSPASLFGGTWEALPEGYALWTTTTAGQGGDTIAAGLPNIRGNIHGNRFGYRYDYGSDLTNSALYGQDAGTVAAGWDNGAKGFNLWFDASKYNTIYGNSTTVQPPAIKIYAWKRIA